MRSQCHGQRKSFTMQLHSRPVRRICDICDIICDIIVRQASTVKPIDTVANPGFPIGGAPTQEEDANRLLRSATKLRRFCFYRCVSVHGGVPALGGACSGGVWRRLPWPADSY